MIPFRDAEQRGRVCRTLLSAAGLAPLWGARGPTPLARSLVARGGCSLSPAKRGLLLTAWALFHGEPLSVRLDELVNLAEAEPLFHLLIAALYGPDAIDAWLEQPRPEGYLSSARAVHIAAARLFDEARAVLAEGRSEAVNISAAPDACALGVRQMADYAMVLGVDVVEDDEERHQRALHLAVRALGMFATLSAAQAAASPPTE